MDGFMQHAPCMETMIYFKLAPNFSLIHFLLLNVNVELLGQHYVFDNMFLH